MEAGERALAPSANVPFAQPPQRSRLPVSASEIVASLLNPEEAIGQSAGTPAQAAHPRGNPTRAAPAFAEALTGVLEACAALLPSTHQSGRRNPNPTSTPNAASNPNPKPPEPADAQDPIPRGWPTRDQPPDQLGAPETPVPRPQNTNPGAQSGLATKTIPVSKVKRRPTRDPAGGEAIWELPPRPGARRAQAGGRRPVPAGGADDGVADISLAAGVLAELVDARAAWAPCVSPQETERVLDSASKHDGAQLLAYVPGRLEALQQLGERVGLTYR